MKFYLGVLLLLTGIFGLYLSSLLPAVDFNNSELLSVLAEAKKNRIIMSIAIMIAGLVIIIDQKK